MNYIDTVNKLILLATDSGASYEEARTAAIQACTLIRKYHLSFSESIPKYLDHEMSILKDRGNYFSIDYQNDRILIKSIRQSKSGITYIYYPASGKWVTSNKPERKYNAHSIEELLDKYINERPPWEK